MTSKDKAKELVDKYEKENYHTTMPECENINAKLSALICVDEIMNSYPTTVETFNNGRGLNIVHADNRKYWKEVRNEINKL
tara:strand:+ start:21 stop:263 length:243 start_codon:yes stop_codon:yes gene_type:complete